MASAELTTEIKDELTTEIKEFSDKNEKNEEGEQFNLEPTKETAEEIVANIFSQVSDEAIKKSLERMGNIENELKMKVEQMQSSFQELYDSMMEDIEKFKAIDKSNEGVFERVREIQKSLNTDSELKENAVPTESNVGLSDDQVPEAVLPSADNQNIPQDQAGVSGNTNKTNEALQETNEEAKAEVNKNTETNEVTKETNVEANKGKGKKKKKKGSK